MAITTMDGLIAAMQPFGVDVQKASFANEAAGVLATSLYVAGVPGAATAYAGGLNGAALTSLTGAIPVPAAVGGKNIHLVRFEFVQASGCGACTYIDRLWHNNISAVTTLTAQTITHPGLPARDNNGATAGFGVMVAMEVMTTATTNAGAITNTTISYTNSAGTAGRTGTLASFPATAVAGTFVPFNLQAGDQGVRTIESVTLGTSYVTGTIGLVQYREMASLGAPLANVNVQNGPIDLGLPRIYDNAVIQQLLLPTGTTIGVTNSQLTFAQG